MVGAKMDWDRLKVFQTVADAGSINAAAKSLCRSYSKVSKDLEELERALGHRLFERSIAKPQDEGRHVWTPVPNCHDPSPACTASGR